MSVRRLYRYTRPVLGEAGATQPPPPPWDVHEIFEVGGVVYAACDNGMYGELWRFEGGVWGEIEGLEAQALLDAEPAVLAGYNAACDRLTPRT